MLPPQLLPPPWWLLRVPLHSSAGVWIYLVDVDMSVDMERLVLSEVHVGQTGGSEKAERVSRYAYLTPPTATCTSRPVTTRQDEATGIDTDDNSSENSDSEGETSEGIRSVARRRKRPRTESQRRTPAHEVLTVVHRTATSIGLVGQQVWSSAFLLGDFVLTHEEVFAGRKVLELGAGPGVSGLIAARVAARCYLTDYHQEVLKLLARNVEANRHLFASERLPIRASATATTADDTDGTDGDNAEDGEGEGGVAAVRELDWFTFSREEGPTDEAVWNSPAEGKNQIRARPGEEACVAAGGEHGRTADKPLRPFSWRKGELDGLLRSASRKLGGGNGGGGGGLVILAADVIYDESLTEALFDVLRLLMPVPEPPPAAYPLEDSCSGGPESARGAVDGDHTRRANANGDLAADSDRRRRADKIGESDVGEDRRRRANENLTSAVDIDEKRGPINIGKSAVDEDQKSWGNRGEESAADKFQRVNNALAIAGVTAGGEKPAAVRPDSARARLEGEAVMYLALEKRFNFSLAEMSVAATGYNALLRNVLDVTPKAGATRVARAEDRPQQEGQDSRVSFEGRRLPLSFAQCFRYRRSGAMELWEIRRRAGTPPKCSKAL